MVVLVEYDEALFTPMGFEADMLAQVGATWEVHQTTTTDEVIAVARDADVVAIQSIRPTINRQAIEAFTRCRCVIRAGAGYDNVDYQAATERGIMVCNTPTYCTDDVADHAMALLLSALDTSPAGRGHAPRSLCREKAVPTRRMKGTTVGIIGLGRIGSTFARRVRGWDVEILVYDPYITQERAASFGATLVDFDTLLARTDFISIHCPLTDETYHMFDRQTFAKAKPGLVLVNTARGPIVEQGALIEAVEQGRVWSAGLDVFEEEPLPANSPLIAYDNILLTPHVSANSPEARHDVWELVCKVSIDVLQGRVPEFVVNPEVLDHLRVVE
jgi:D-3-phosphoglycerate dehydrogenase